MENIQKIDQRIIKKTFFRYIQFGPISEMYIYEKPIFYNFPPLRTDSGSEKIADSRRSDNLSKARQKINRLVVANTNWNECAPRFVTFTFAKNIDSLKEANIYWQQFIRKFKTRYPKIKYLGVIEFQKRGAVHYHVLFFNLKYKKGIKQSIATLWGHGFIKFKSARKIEKIEHLGLYLAKYLQKEIMDIRLVGEKAFFTSKNLTQPIILRNNTTCEMLHSKMVEKGGTLESYQSSHFGIIKKITLNHESKNTRSGDVDKIEDSIIY